MTANLLIADRAFDADRRVLDPLAAAGKSAVIPPRPNRLIPRQFDRELYKQRHLIENFFCKLKQFRAIATRYDKTARNFLAAIHLAAATIWLKGRQALVGQVLAMLRPCSASSCAIRHTPRFSRVGRGSPDFYCRRRSRTPGTHCRW